MANPDIMADQQAQLSSVASADQKAVATEWFTRFKAACTAGDGYAAREAALKLADMTLNVLPDVA